MKLLQFIAIMLIALVSGATCCELFQLKQYFEAATVLFMTASTCWILVCDVIVDSAISNARALYEEDA